MDVIERFKNRAQLAKEITVVLDSLSLVFNRMPTVELRHWEIEQQKGLSRDWCELTIRKFSEHFIRASDTSENPIKLDKDLFGEFINDFSVSELIDLTLKYRQALKADEEIARKNGHMSAKDLN